jgi:hypothetical protein
MSDNIRIAQTGGVGGGGQGSPFSPGASPIGRGGRNRGGHEINLYVDEDASFDKLLRKTHIDFDGRDVNIESRLTPQHRNYEESIPYLLTPEERLRAKLRAQLHNYKQSLENAANDLHKNSPKYIKENFNAKPEHLMTMEQSLEDRHKYKKDYKFLGEEYKDPDKPSRLHFAISENDINRVAEDYQVRRRNRITEEYAEPRNKYDVEQFSYEPMGKTPLLEHGEDLNQYFNDLINVNTPDQDGFQEYGLKDTILTYPNPDANVNLIPRKFTGEESLELKQINPLESIERNMHTPKMPSSYYDFVKPTPSEDASVEEQYDTLLNGFVGHTF